MSEPEIIYEDENFLAINKPAGLLVHRAQVADGGRGRNADEESTLVDWILKKYPEIKKVGDLSLSGEVPPERPGIVHRLDKDTSGVMLIAKNQKYFDYLKSLFQKHLIKKTYLALVRGNIKSDGGEIKKPIGIKNGTTKRSVHSDKMVKEAVTVYRVSKRFRGSDGSEYSLLEVEPQTGRTHQIRVHMSSIGHPIVGDRIYGSKIDLSKQSTGSGLMLHALRLDFTTEEGKRLRVEASPPQKFQDYLSSLVSAE